MTLDVIMAKRNVVTALVIISGLLQSGWNPSRGADSEAGIEVTTSPGVSVPKLGELKRKIEDTLRQPAGTKIYVREGDKWREVPPQLPKDVSAVVRSFNQKEGKAYVHLVFPKYKMPVAQIWRFNGESWNGDVDPGMIIR